VNLKAIKNCQNNGITIYPIVVNDIYFEGKRKKNYVKIEINVNGAKKLGSDKYKQDETLTKKIHELYEVLNLKLV
jgi:Mrp family chromosome partitioning ATPase